MSLTQALAEQRSQHIQKGSINYNFHVCLESGNSYSGYAQISFTLTMVPNQLAIDFQGTPTKLIQNGQNLPVSHKEGFIELQIQKLKSGSNIIGIHYTNKYNNDGSGCVSFVDVDQKQYIYTQFQPYYANRVFPCFDQPDLKANMHLSIISPLQWKKVLSNQYATKEQVFVKEGYVNASHKSVYPHELESYLQGKHGKMTIFPKTKLLPTYLYCFIAGHYLQLQLPVQQQYKNIPMSLYSIESLYKPLTTLAPFIFQITIKSMQFYQSFFNHPFPFNKYDQIFAHQYKWGAMENAGIVTFNDLYLFKEQVSVDRMLAFSTTISHQLSHHWFGNLVTMKWWDDLWLNQAFATFISYFCLEQLKKTFTTINFESSMTSFFQRKGRGYHQDQMITTHPIRNKVINTSVADSMFDGITYSKGAGSMKQFFYLIGAQNFSKAISQYFKKYEWSNTTIDEFLGQMATVFKNSEFSLDEWKKLWLETSSLNVLEADWKSQNNHKDAKLIIKQSAYTKDHPTLRPHKIKVGLFKENCQTDVLQVMVRAQTETIVTYDGTNNYKAILLNYEDHGFVRITIDPVSLQFFKNNLNSIPDTLSRILIYSSFYEMIRDGQLTSHQLVAITTKSLPQQPSDSIVQKVLDQIHTAISTYTPRQYRQELNNQMFRFIYELIPKIPQDQQNRVTILKNKLLNYATSQESKNIVVKWSRGQEEELKGIDMTVGQKWRTVAKAFTLSNLTSEEKELIFEEQRKSDPSDTAKKYRFMCDGLKSSEEQFQNIYQLFKDKDCSHSVSLKRSIASGWCNSHHQQRLVKYRDRYFKDLQELIPILSQDHLQVFYSELAPIDDDLEFQITNYEKINFPLGKQKSATDIRKMVDDLKRRVKAYQIYNKPAL